MVILWLSELDTDAMVGVEVDDDIVVQLTQGKEITNIYEQAKHTIRKQPPFSDKSEDLWKTLSIWVKAVLEGRANPTKAKFSPLSNKIIPKNRLLYSLHTANYKDPTHLKSICQQLKKDAASLRNKLKPFGDIIINCPNDKLESIVNAIEIIEPTYEHSHSEYKRRIRKNLSMSDDLPYDDIVDKLFGYISRQLIDNWKDRKESWIEVKAFNNQYSQLVAEFTRKPFIEKTTDLLPVSKKEIENNRSKTYVSQLKIIDCNDNEILEAIHDYYRASSERDRFAKDGEISKENFEHYYQDLQEKWKAISRPRFRASNTRNSKQIGYEVYYETIQYKGKLNSYEPEQSYTHKGAYHHLSNELEIGWHPKWEGNLKKKRR